MICILLLFSFAKSGLETIGVDINKDLVEKINLGKFPLKDEPGYNEIFDKRDIYEYDCRRNVQINFETD